MYDCFSERVGMGCMLIIIRNKLNYMGIIHIHACIHTCMHTYIQVIQGPIVLLIVLYWSEWWLWPLRIFSFTKHNNSNNNKTLIAFNHFIETFSNKMGTGKQTHKTQWNLALLIVLKNEFLIRNSVMTSSIWVWSYFSPWFYFFSFLTQFYVLLWF